MEFGYFFGQFEGIT